jgi:hypothetical protein
MLITSAPETGVREIDNLVVSTVHDRLHYVGLETLRHFNSDRRWHDELCLRDDNINKKRTIMHKPLFAAR